MRLSCVNKYYLLDYLLNISATAETSDFTFRIQLGFAKAHHKITLKGKSGHGPGLGELPKILMFHFNIYTMAVARDFKFDTQLGFEIPIMKLHHRKKWAWPWARGAPYNFVVPLQYLHNG